MWEDLLELFPTPVGAEELGSAEEAEVGEGETAVAAQELDSVGAAEFGEDVADGFAWGESLAQERAEVPGEALAAEGGGDAADVIGLLVDVHLAAVADEVGGGCEAGHAGADDNYAGHRTPPYPLPQLTELRQHQTLIPIAGQALPPGRRNGIGAENEYRRNGGLAAALACCLHQVTCGDGVLGSSMREARLPVRIGR